MKKKAKKAAKKVSKKKGVLPIEKLSKKLNLHEREIQSIIYTEHEHTHLVDPDSLIEMELPIPGDLMEQLQVMAKTLKVSLNSVVVGLVISGAKDVIEYQEYLKSKK